MAFLALEHLQKSFGPNVVVKGFDLTVGKGEFVSLLGPSGCGKTTVLRMVAGFESPSAGTIRIGERDVTRLRANQRNIGMVFQAYALFPNLTVAANVGFGLRIAGRPKAEIAARVEEMLLLVGLPGFGARYPFQLSGGQQQRIALARALAPKPQVLLLDEPLSALDAKIRVSLRNEIRAIQRDLGITTIFVTHDQEEALSMSDRVVVMNGGVAEQIGTPHEIYARPATRFVATFVGQLNALEARLTDPGTGLLDLEGRAVALGRGIEGPAGRMVGVALRPEAIALGARPGNDVVIRVPVREVDFMGSVVRVRALLGAAPISLDLFSSSTTPPPAAGDEIEISFASRDLLLT
ncbi:MAG: ABC transporter ATP-binding protein [Amaricoccus sp.]